VNIFVNGVKNGLKSSIARNSRETQMKLAILDDDYFQSNGIIEVFSGGFKRSASGVRSAFCFIAAATNPSTASEFGQFLQADLLTSEHETRLSP
jgi:hypothetical protein